MSLKLPLLTETRLTVVIQVIRELCAGRSNAVGSFTLTPDEDSTDVAAVNCGAESKIFLTPRTANAIAEMTNGTLMVSAITGGSFTVDHANNSQDDRTFDYVAIG